MCVSCHIVNFEFIGPQYDNLVSCHIVNSVLTQPSKFKIYNMTHR